MSQDQEAKVEKVLSDMDLRFKSGNSVPVTRAHISDVDYQILKTFVTAELRRRQSNRAWSEIQDRQL